MNNWKLKNAKYVAAILLATLANSVYAAGNVNVLFGNKSLDSGDWEPVDSQNEFGFGVEFNQPEWPVALVASYLSSEESKTDSTIPAEVKGSTEELSIGARSYLGNNERARFFVEGGLASIRAEFEGEFTQLGLVGSDSDSAIGFWFGAGADMMVTDMFSIGLLGRLSSADVTLFDVDGKAGGTHFALFAAYHFE